MRIQRVRAARTRELGELDLPLGSGLVGWSGGTARDRWLFADLLSWILALPNREVPPPGELESDPAVLDPPRAPLEVERSLTRSTGSWISTDTPDRAEAEVRVGGEVVHLRAGHGGAGSSPDAEPVGETARVLHGRLGLSADALAFAWRGGGWVEPEPLWRAGVRLLASRMGLGRLERAVARIGGLSSGADIASDGGSGELGSGARGELATVTARLNELADVPRRFRSLEAELRSLRADAAEVAGDLEVATMDWLRERQDAETHLQQYRDRARELRSRIEEMEEMGPEGSCPFCGRVLGDHLDQVMAELQEEWEDLVQDGSWWRRRRDQLELKPDVLQALERRSVQLQAEVEDRAERLERCRFELREWDELRDRREELLERAGGTTGSLEGIRSDEEIPMGRRRGLLLQAFDAARNELLSEARARLAAEAGSLLNRLSGGRILALVDGGQGAPRMVEDGRIVRGSTVEDRASASLALHLALVLQLQETGVSLDSVVVGETFRALGPEARVRSVEVLRELRDRIPQVLLLSAGDAVDATPERFDHILEFRPDRNRPSLKRLSGGVGRLRIEPEG